MSANARHRRVIERQARQRRLTLLGDPGDSMDPWRESDDPPDILPEILAARCLGISYGDPGPRLPDDTCRQCWGERYVWVGNGWGLRHAGGKLFGCDHSCHEGEVLMASA